MYVNLAVSCRLAAFLLSFDFVACKIMAVSVMKIYERRHVS
jgi:hypothetical protein